MYVFLFLCTIQTTQIGRLVFKLRAAKNHYTVRLANGLIKKWKQIIEESSTRRSKEAQDDSSSCTSVENASSSSASTSTGVHTSDDTTASLSKQPLPLSTCGNKGDGGKEHSALKQQSLSGSCPETMGQEEMKHKYNALSQKRRKCVDQLRDRFQTVAESYGRKFFTEKKLKLLSFQAALKLEEAIFKAHGKQCYTHVPADYRKEVLSFHFSLGSNASLALALLTLQKSFEDVVALPKEELANQEVREQLKKYKEDARKESQLDWEHQNMERLLESAGMQKGEVGMFVCRRCKSSNTKHTQKQLLSGDEPMTVFVTCDNCGKVWRM